MAYDPQAMKVHELNESLSFIFNLCDGNSSCEELTVKLMERYGLDIETASKEIYRALKILANDELIEPQ
ncbi:MAG: PqqD family protein [Pseudomonadota bacterium]